MGQISTKGIAVSLGDFFKQIHYDADIAKEQLMYSMGLFADRNQVNQQLPFVTSVYLFNNWDQCIKEYYSCNYVSFWSSQIWKKKSLYKYANNGSKEKDTGNSRCMCNG